jgi:hypothetical protein
MSATHTYVILEISPRAFAEIHGKLVRAGYQHAFHEDDGKVAIDMHGIAVKAEEEHTTVWPDGSITGPVPLTFRRNLGSGGYGK